MVYNNAGKLFMISGLLLTASFLPTAHAESDGRYRAIVLHEGGSSNQSAVLAPKVFILDSRDGHIWTWEQNSRIRKEQGGMTFGTLLTYQGKLKEGSKTGEIVGQSQ